MRYLTDISVPSIDSGSDSSSGEGRVGGAHANGGGGSGGGDENAAPLIKANMVSAAGAALLAGAYIL